MPPKTDLRDQDRAGSADDKPLSQRLLERIRGARETAEKRQTERRVKRESQRLKRERRDRRLKEIGSEARGAIEATRLGGAAMSARERATSAVPSADETDSDDDQRSILSGLLGDVNGDGEPEAFVASFDEGDQVRAADRDGDGDADVLFVRSRDTIDADEITVAADSVDVSEAPPEPGAMATDAPPERTPPGDIFGLGAPPEEAGETGRTDERDVFDPDEFF